MILTILAIVFLALYVISFAVAALEPGGTWRVSARDVVFHFAAGFAVALLVLR